MSIALQLSPPQNAAESIEIQMIETIMFDLAAATVCRVTDFDRARVMEYRTHSHSMRTVHALTIRKPVPIELCATIGKK
jgi:hypothetical protein